MQNGAHSVPVVDPGPADGVFSLLWLVIALPLLGALVILVGGPLTKGRIGSWSHCSAAPCRSAPSASAS